jgi:hypothetical protein
MTTATAVKNAINWFEIPSSDFDRAVTFYETIFGQELRKGDFMGTPTAVFAYEKPCVSGCILKEEGQTPSSAGTRVYLNADGIFDEVLMRVSKAGGKVETVIELPNGLGRSAHIIDSEGNRVGLHTY